MDTIHVYDTKTQKKGYDTNAIKLLHTKVDGHISGTTGPILTKFGDNRANIVYFGKSIPKTYLSAALGSP